MTPDIWNVLSKYSSNERKGEKKYLSRTRRVYDSDCGYDSDSPIHKYLQCRREKHRQSVLEVQDGKT